MKVRAARQGDIADIIVLARVVGATGAAEAARLAAEIFEGEPLSVRSLAVLADLDGALREA
ncbi:MAG: hypothetical protein M3450_04550 [Actinomycetota bacterium]|nr:hypothetical protein [Actinomycetota bacterium]